MYCKNCGNKLSHGATFCEQCGQKVTDFDDSGSGKGLVIGGIVVGVLGISLVVVGILFGVGVLPPKSDESSSIPQAQVVSSTEDAYVSGGTGTSKEEVAQANSSSSSSKEEELAPTHRTETARIVEPTTVVIDSGQGGQQSEADTPAPSGSESEPVQTSTPVFTSAEASSELPPEDNGIDYKAQNVLDDNMSTAWNEGADGNGTGQWLRVSASSNQVVRGVRVMAGYTKTEEIYWKNNRPCEVTVTLSDGYSMKVTFKDEFNVWQEINFDRAHETSYIMFTINSAYEGSTWDDNAITEVVVY